MNVTKSHSGYYVIDLTELEAREFLANFDAETPLEIELRNALYVKLHG